MGSGDPHRPILGVVFDGDDTLWETERLYDAARSKARRIVETSGLDGARWEEIERRVDVENVAALGFTTQRFPASCVQAYQQLAAEVGVTPEPGVMEAILRAANAVFQQTPRVVEGARETLEDLRAGGHKLALMTKGDFELQRRRIERSGLRDLFDVIEVVSEKSPDLIREVVDRMGIDAASVCMVGNSIRSDILPAIEAGLQAVWIDAHVWEHERAFNHVRPAGFRSVRRLADLGALLSGACPP